MSKIEILWQIVLADFRERTRRYSFLITLMVALFIGYLVLTGKYSYIFGSFKPEYNSHWVGTTVALAGAAMFSLMGFYIVRTSISRDRETGVGEILATTSLSNSSYLGAKFVSNLLVLWSMVAALAVTAFLGMIVIMPFENIDLVAFITPFVLVPLATTVTVAGAAVLFDTALWMRGTIGNIIYFFFAEFMIVSGLFGIPYIDAAGMGLLETSVKGAISSVYPGEKIPMSIGFVGLVENKLSAVATKSFVWNGIDWTLPLVLSRLIWPAIALVMLGLAILLFDRFEQSRKTSRKTKVKSGKENPAETTEPKRTFVPSIAYYSIPSVRHSFSIVPLIVAELKLSLRELKPVWFLIGLALIVAELFVPFDISRKYLIPAAMIWPLALWSSVGTREIRCNMRSLLFCSAGVHTRQYLALLLSGIIIATTMCAPMIFRAAIAGEISYLMLLVSAVILLPTSAFALGAVSGSRKLFEITYLMIWYGGSIDHITPIDLLGTSEASTSLTRVFVFFALAVAAALIAYVGRRKMAET